GSNFVLEDLDSTNGTVVNDRRVSRHTLQTGDIVQIGNHTLEFDAEHGGRVDAHAAAERIVSNPGETVFPDAAKHQAPLHMLRDTVGDDPSMGAAAAATSKGGVVRVLEGRAY